MADSSATVKPVRLIHIELDPQSAAEMRNLRLHHWKSVLVYRKKQEQYDYEAMECRDKYTKARLAADMQKFKDIANFHLGVVQLLNQFFPIGDYAEYDFPDSRQKLHTP